MPVLICTLITHAKQCQCTQHACPCIHNPPAPHSPPLHEISCFTRIHTWLKCKPGQQYVLQAPQQGAAWMSRPARRRPAAPHVRGPTSSLSLSGHAASQSDISSGFYMQSARGVSTRLAAPFRSLQTHSAPQMVRSHVAKQAPV